MKNKRSAPIIKSEKWSKEILILLTMTPNFTYY